MIKIKTGEAKGLALDWLVGKCEGFKPSAPGSTIDYSPSTNWDVGGPIIDRRKIQWCILNGQVEAWLGFDYIDWRANWDSDSRMKKGSGFGVGPTFLVAAMRCYISSKLGDEAEVPAEFI